MSALENSFTQQKESPIRGNRHSLCQELQQFQDKFDNNSLDISKPQTQSEDCNDNSFISPNKNNRLQHEPQLQQHSQNQEVVSPQDQHNESPKTITLIEDGLLSKQSLSVSSKLSQYNDSVDNESFAAFLGIRDSSYNGVVKSFQVLFENVSSMFKQRMKNLSQTYLSFLQIKSKQQKSYSSVSFGHIQNNKNHVIYIDCKSIADQIRNKIQQEKRKRLIYARNLQQITNKLEKHIHNTIAQVQFKGNKIKQIHKKIIQISNEMTDLMIPQNRKLKKKGINPQVYSCSFIRTKYLIGKQKSYLLLIKNFLQKILNFIGQLFLQIQPKNCLTIKQSLSSYFQVFGIYSPEKKLKLQEKFGILSKTHCYEQIYKQVSKILELCVPEPILPFNYMNRNRQYGQKLLKKIIQALISQSQSLVYLPVIELESKDYVYHSKNKAIVNWIKINHQNKYNSQIIEEYQTFVILTMEGHLILQLRNNNQNEDQQKMAILKLSEIKLSRKNNQIYLSDKGKGMLGYLFSSNTILGSLTFIPLDEGNQKQEQNKDIIINQFISRVKQILQHKKQMNALKMKN